MDDMEEVGKKPVEVSIGEMSGAMICGCFVLPVSP